MNTTLGQVLSLVMWRVKTGIIQEVYGCTRPFKAFSAAIIALKVHIKKSECKANHKYQWS